VRSKKKDPRCEKLTKKKLRDEKSKKEVEIFRAGDGIKSKGTKERAKTRLLLGKPGEE